MDKVKPQRIELSADDFAKGVNDAIRIVRTLYGEVRSMLDDLTAKLQEPPEQLSRLRVPVQSVVKPNSPPDEKFLRNWIGRLYTFERVDDDETEDDGVDYDEDSGDGSGKNKQIRLYVGQNLVFLKVVLYQGRSLNDQIQPPHLLYGVLRNCQVDSTVKQTGRGIDEALSVKKMYFRRIVEDLHRSTPQGEFTTRAFSQGFSNKREKGTHALKFTLESPAEFHPLFDIRGRDQICKIADHIKALRVPQKRKRLRRAN